MPAALLAAAGRSLLDFIVPPRCLACRVIVDGDGGLCPGCWATLDFIVGRICESCGIPLPVGGTTHCASCLAKPPRYDRARSALRYDDASRPLVLALKHGDRTDAAPIMARWMARAGASLLNDADLIVPVPLHWTRLLSRRFNQSALLAQAVARASGRPWLPDALVRRKRTPSQGHLSRLGRDRNVRGAFAINRRAADRIAGKRILLVDDVLTSGATVAACTRMLRRGGASAVDVLALARVYAQSPAPDDDA